MAAGPVFPCAYLRTFQPLEAFPPQERTRWERYIVGGGRARPARPIYRERATVPQGGLGLLSSAEGDHADLRLIEGTYYVCPWRTRLRELASLLSLRDSTVPEMVDAFVPEAEARRAARELARLRRRSHSGVPFMLQSPWHVPIRWFVLVEQDERRLEEAEGRYCLSYRTTTTKGRKRAETALRALRRSDLSPLSELVAGLGRCLSALDPRAILELDWGTVADRFAWDEVDNGVGGQEIQDAVAALAPGNVGRW